MRAVWLPNGSRLLPQGAEEPPIDDLLTQNQAGQLQITISDLP
jgi:hypothetical protein